ncbi:hypothetical protein EJ05DRAFT_126606 [Pseudovirgaria hyperparasitica]|uniref:Uncharacterized protein n=1 Tax=Pseudovirgaria hyperparasitica TaxID=470096 RepID=A0A6A6VX13_9PEZI|nr:uncharacterized protein EJ05DRAFT_126606 [Pseudovirgaria hyperparasitica]KAF2755218.1 hypothetical protein EJ05DRAFT_126606 [Pseudovirgaria hyperparasitica]
MKEESSMERCAVEVQLELLFDSLACPFSLASFLPPVRIRRLLRAIITSNRRVLLRRIHELIEELGYHTLLNLFSCLIYLNVLYTILK